MRIGIRREAEGAIAFVIQDDSSDGGVGAKAVALLPAFDGHALETRGCQGNGGVAFHVGTIRRRGHRYLAAQDFINLFLRVHAEGIEGEMAFDGR